MKSTPSIITAKEPSVACASQATGPRSEAGKANSSKNSIKHGAYSVAILVLGETQEAFDELRADMRTSLRPEGPLESRVVDRMVALWWRLERAQRVERETLESSLAQARYHASNILDGVGLEGLCSLPRPHPGKDAPAQTAFHWQEGQQIERLQRYEGQIERAFFRLMHELERLQLRRQGQILPPPLVADIQIDAIGPVFVSANQRTCE